jgi:hypothetical protein
MDDPRWHSGMLGVPYPDLPHDAEEPDQDDTLAALEVCECTHVRDEHANDGPCTVVLWQVPPLGRDQPCDCELFEPVG